MNIIKIIQYFIVIVLLCMAVYLPYSLSNANTVSSSYVLVQGSPSSMLTPYPVEIMTLKDQLLSDSKEIVAEASGPDFIKIYHLDDLIIMGNRARDGSFIGQYLQPGINNDPHTFIIKMCKKCVFPDSYLLNKKDELIFMMRTGTGGIDDFVPLIIGYSLTNKRLVDVTLDDIKYAQAFGTPGGNRTSADPLRSVFANGKKAIFHYYKKIDLGWTYPDDFVIQGREAVYLSINNPFIRAFTAPQMIEKRSDGKDIAHWKVQNKQTGLWSSISFKGPAGGVRAFGPWIAAEEGYQGFNQQFTSEKYDGKYEPATFRLGVDKYHLTGVLYLTHAIDKRFITFDTHEQDSEILLVDHDRVFYRAGDDLYSADIQGNSLVNNQLLVKDKRIVDVHWMMAGGKK